jgi:uncharacterized protein YjeT (DUF2065 family)
MEETTEMQPLPDLIRRTASLVLTVVAVVLYAMVLGNAIIRSFLEDEPKLSDNMVRAAGLLSGLVGSVVTAGFARSRRPVSLQVEAPHPVGGRAPTGWSTLKPPSLAMRNFLALADTLGLRTAPDPLSRQTTVDAEEPEVTRGLSAAVWVALLYFGVYFLVGIGGFAVTVWREGAPEVVANSAWVWVGTVISSAYSFLGLDSG